MNDDKIIENIIKKSQMKIAVSEFNKEENEMPKLNKILKMVATILIAFVVGTGLVYATGTVAEKIWKEPESYTLNGEITEEEKENSISEEEAQNIANTYLDKIGFSDETAEYFDFTKEYSSGENVWLISSDNVTLRLNGSTGEITSVTIPTRSYTIPKNYGIDRVEARKVAQELFEKYRVDSDGDYELVRLTRNMETDEGSYIWYATFYKKYGELLNQYESYQIGWIPTINALHDLSIQNYTYENNEETITKEEAIKIATEKDNQIETSKTIAETDAGIQIQKTNTTVYLRENFKEEFENGTLNLEKTGENTYKYKDDATFYKTENRVRKVWTVVIKYETTEGLTTFSYYIDCTTGEIIGGATMNSLTEIDNMISDPYNLIEK